MNLAQSLGVAAAALVMGLSAGGVAPAQTASLIVAEARARLEPNAVRAAVADFAASLERTRDPQHLAAPLSDSLASIHRVARLRTTSNDGSEPKAQVLRAPSDDEAHPDSRWLALAC